MALTIRLTRMGSKKRPFYRLVVLERASRRDGRPLEFLGHYNPMTEPAEIVIDTVKLRQVDQAGRHAQRHRPLARGQEKRLSPLLWPVSRQGFTAHLPRT